MKVKKRSGRLANLAIEKIDNMAQDAVHNLDGTSKEELINDSHIMFYDGIKTTEIQETLIKTAIDKIDIDKPNWSFVAARLLTYDLYHNVGKVLNTEKGEAYSDISIYIDYGVSQGRIITGLKEKFDLDRINKAINPERDLQFTYLGIKTMFDRYLLKDLNGDRFELPQFLFMTVAMFVAQNENGVLPEGDSLPSGLSIDKQLEYVRTSWAISFYDMMSKFEVMAATPTLSNGRTPRSQLSSCFLGATPDTIEGIFDTYKEQSLLSKFGGGMGWDWTLVRGSSSPIDGHKGAAGGQVPFLKIENDVAIAVDQLGTRAGAIAVYTEPWHIDIEDFLELKKTSGEERRRAHDLFPALWLNDLFMQRVEENKDWSLFSPYNVPGLKEAYGDNFYQLYRKFEDDSSIPRNTVNAKTLWKKILREYFETGTPFLTFKDSANRSNPNKHAGVIRSSNLCTEIFQNTSPNEYNIKIDFTDGSSTTYSEGESVEVDGGFIKPISKVSMTDKINGKSVYFIGKDVKEGETAVCNLASINLAKIHTKEDIERVTPIAIRFLDNVVDLNLYPVKKAKNTNLRSRAVGLGMMGEAHLLAKKKIQYGTKEHFNYIDNVMEMISYNAIDSSSNLGKEKGNYPNFDGSEWSKGVMPHDHANDAVTSLTNVSQVYDWTGLREKTKNNMRNGYLMAVAPTSSISILTGTSQANEPIFARFWKEDNLSGEIPVCAPDLSPDTWTYYIPAYEVNQVNLIKAGAVRQKWIDQGQSLNIFISLEKASGKHLNDIYMSAWKYNLKSTYYLRSKSVEAAKEVEVEDRSMECSGCQ